VTTSPLEPPPSRWAFPPPQEAPGRAPLGIGADLEPGTLVAAYRTGIFPWPDDAGRLLWWSPDPRAIFDLESWRCHRSIGRSVRRAGWRFTVDGDFQGVMRACGEASGSSRRGKLYRQLRVRAGLLSQTGTRYDRARFRSQLRTPYRSTPTGRCSRGRGGSELDPRKTRMATSL